MAVRLASASRVNLKSRISNLLDHFIGLQGDTPSSKAYSLICDSEFVIPYDQKWLDFLAGFEFARELCDTVMSDAKAREKIARVRKAAKLSGDFLGFSDKAQSRAQSATSVTDELTVARRKIVGGGIDWSVEPADEAERHLRDETLASMDALSIQVLMNHVMASYAYKIDWPSDVRRAYDEAHALEASAMAADFSVEMRERVAEARSPKSPKVVTLRLRDPEPVA